MAGGVDPFFFEPGIWSGRIQPEAIAPPEGDYVFVLGADQPGWTGRFVDGDEVSVAQTGEYAPATLIRFRASVREPEVIPVGWAWTLVMRADGTDQWELPLEAGGRLRSLSDLSLLVAGLPATIAIGFALRVTGPPGLVGDLEVPGVYLDELILDDSVSGMVVTNPVPNRGEVEVPRNSAITFAVLDASGDDPDPLKTQIYVDGVLAFDGSLGGAQPGFDVLAFAFASGILHFTVTQLAMLFEPLALVTVSVSSENVGGTESVSDEWTFQTADEVRPIVVDAFATAEDRVRVTFNEAVLQADASGLNDALNPTSWSLTPVQPDALTPVYPAEVVGVESVAAAVVDLILDDALSNGIEYVVRGTVADLFGNVSEPPNDSFTMPAFNLECPADRRFDIYSFFSDLTRRRDATVNFDLLKFIRCLQDVEDRTLCEIDQRSEIWDPDTAPEPYLDHMLAGLGNPFDWAFEELDEAGKRRLIRLLVEIYKSKGTSPGIINVVRFFLGIDILIDEYASYGWILDVDLLGDTTILGTSVQRLLYSFDILSVDTILTDEQRTRIRQIAEYMKPAHTHLIRILDPVEVLPVDHLELGVSLLFEDEWILH